MQTRITTLVSTAIAAARLFCPVLASGADCDAIAVTNQPQSQVVLEGCPATFSVGLTGTGPYHYQWWREGKAIPDGTNSSYTIAVGTLSDNGTRIQVTITNNCSRVTSSEANLYIS